MSAVTSPRRGSASNSEANIAAAASAAAADTSHHFAIFGLSRLVTAVLASLLWMAASSGLIMLNKDLLSHGFPYPMALSGFGMGFSSVAAYVTCHVLKLVETKRVVTWKFYMTRIMPVGFFMACTLLFGNLVYLYLTVAFIQMLKAFTPVITMITLFLAGMEVPSRRLVLSVLCIAAGTAMASLGQVNLSYVGLLFMLLSETTEALRLVMTQVLLTGLKFHPIEGLMYLAPSCFFWLGSGSLLMELRPMLKAGGFVVMASAPFKFFLAGCMGFAVNALGYIVIQSASSLTLKVLGTVKNAVVVWLGIFFLHETVTTLQGAGYAVSLGAFVVYQRLKMQQLSAPGEAAATPAPRQFAGAKYESVPQVDDEAKLGPGKESV